MCVALLTVGRFPGETRGNCVGPICPKPVDGGPIDFSRDGDIVSIDVDEGCVNLEFATDEHERVCAEWTPPPPRCTSKAPARHWRGVSSATLAKVQNVLVAVVTA